jgi:hypothetical protein
MVPLLSLHSLSQMAIGAGRPQLPESITPGSQSSSAISAIMEQYTLRDPLSKEAKK